MKKEMLELIKKVIEDNSKLESLEAIYHLYDEIQYCENIVEMAESFYQWLHKNYQVTNINFSLFDLDDEKTISLIKEGKKFAPDDPLAFYFIVNTHTNVNAIFSFCADNAEHYEKLQIQNSFINAAIFQISPLLQNGIIKKYHIESSSIDSVTNVYNRKYLIKHLEKVISLSHKEHNNIAFLMIGIDRFKAVIEEFDYDIGDKVLIELAKVIHSQIKDFDIVSRLTGDEFLVALVNNPDTEKVTEIAQNIIDKFADTKIVVNEQTNQILQKTICIGISFYPNDGTDITQVLKNADYFLSEAKNKGRSKYAIYKKEDESYINLF